MNSSLDAIARDIEKFILRLVPEWSHFGVVLSSRIGRPLADPWRYGGFWSPATDLLYREYLPHLPGRAPAIMVNDVYTTREAKANSFGGEWNIRREMLAIAVHEVAHALNYGPPYYGCFMEGAPDEVFENVRTLVRNNLATANVLEFDEPPFVGHEWPWIRLALHLCYRAGLADEAFAPSAIIPNRRYVPTLEREYNAALGDEPERMKDWTFQAIREHPPPPAFAELWKRDMDCWNETLKERREIVVTELLEKIGIAKKRKDADNRKSYHDLVVSVYNGKLVDDEAAVEILKAAGKSEIDLASDQGDCAILGDLA
jgi:hypothetical protein